MRLDALHLRGVDDMSTKDIMNFFQEYGPSAIEWIDDTSCEYLFCSALRCIQCLKRWISRP